MQAFLTRFGSLVSGVLSGMDRLSLVGRLCRLSYGLGLQNYLWAQRVPFKDFAQHSAQVSAQIAEASLRLARQKGREIRYLNSAQHRKEDIAREIAERDRIRSGLICVLRSVDPCMSFQINRNRQRRRLEIKYRPRKCIHLYHYQFHPVFGFMHARIQTWFPFRVYVCINGREWLARQMDQARLKFVRRKNTFTWLEDVAQAQALFDQQLQAAWPTLLEEITASLNPAHAAIFAKFPCRYHWSVDDSEWASDVMFRSRAALEQVYPRLLRYAVTNFTGQDVLRFLAQPLGASGQVPHARRHEISTNLKERLEGTRLKHWLDANSLKMYDKSSVLRCETMIHEPAAFKVWRTVEGAPDASADWRPLRKGLIDLPRRAEVSQVANERYLDALAAVHERTAVRDHVEPLCRPTAELPREGTSPAPTPPAQASAAATAACVAPPPPRPGRRVRALNPFAAGDADLLAAVARPEFCINGLRNRDLCRWLYAEPTEHQDEQRRRSAAVTRKLRLLRAHGLIERVAQTHRYLVTPQGRQKLTALLALRNASVEGLIDTAA